MSDETLYIGREVPEMVTDSPQYGSPQTTESALHSAGRFMDHARPHGDGFDGATVSRPASSLQVSPLARPASPDILDTLEGTAVVLNSYLFNLGRRLRDFGRDLHDAPAEVREAIEEQRNFVQTEFDRAEHIRDRLSDLRYVIARQDACEWRENEEGDWETGCEDCWSLIEGTPAENHMRYCPVCGGLLYEVAYIHDDEDDDDE